LDNVDKATLNRIELFNFDELVKSHFVNDIEKFWKKIHKSPGVKNFKLFEGVSPSF